MTATSAYDLSITLILRKLTAKQVEATGKSTFALILEFLLIRNTELDFRSAFYCCFFMSPV
jgi:hypothetical protein